MGTSAYQQLKLDVLAVLPIERNDWHILIGALIVLIFILVPPWRRSIRAAFTMLLTALVFGLVMEVPDLYDDLRSFGRLRWTASVGDVLRTVLVPAIYFAYRRIVL